MYTFVQTISRWSPPQPPVLPMDSSKPPATKSFSPTLPHLRDGGTSKKLIKDQLGLVETKLPNGDVKKEVRATAADALPPTAPILGFTTGGRGRTRPRAPPSRTLRPERRVSKYIKACRTCSACRECARPATSLEGLDVAGFLLTRRERYNENNLLFPLGPAAIVPICRATTHSC
jgi:hypothetical protein